MSINARSLINKFDVFQATIHDSQPDVVGVTESWAHDGILDSELQLLGYDMFRCDRHSGNRGGGVLLYVKSIWKPVQFYTSSHYDEHVWCQIGDLLIGVCYRSSNTEIVGLDNESKLNKVLHEVSSRNVLIMGDFNYPNIDWSTYTTESPISSGTFRFLETVDDAFYTQHVNKPTRGNSTLDLILTRDPDLVSNVMVLHNLDSSDHSMVSCTVHQACEYAQDKKVIRDYKRGNYNLINTALEAIDWNTFMEGNADDCWVRFKNLLMDLIDRYVPVISSSTKRCTKKPLWMTYKAVRSITRKKKAFHKYKDPNHPAVKAACKSAKAELRKSRKNFEKKLAQNIKNDTKSFFAYARSKSKSKVQVGPLLHDDGNTLDSDDDMVQSFNDYLSLYLLQRMSPVSQNLHL